MIDAVFVAQLYTDRPLPPAVESVDADTLPAPSIAALPTVKPPVIAALAELACSEFVCMDIGVPLVLD